MIRPFTLLSFLAACVSGFYLYAEKQRAQTLSEQIDRTVQTTDAVRMRISELHAEWALLNDPDRLQRLATEFLKLKPVSPAQVVTLAELAARLPPPGNPRPAAEPNAPAAPGSALLAGTAAGSGNASMTGTAAALVLEPTNRSQTATSMAIAVLPTHPLPAGTGKKTATLASEAPAFEPARANPPKRSALVPIPLLAPILRPSARPPTPPLGARVVTVAAEPNPPNPVPVLSGSLLGIAASPLTPPVPLGAKK